MNRPAKLFGAVAIGMGVGLSGCGETPDTSKIQKDGVTYTLHRTTHKDVPDFYLQQGGSSSYTTYIFEKAGGYKGQKVTSYGPVPAMYMHKSMVSIAEVKAGPEDADYKSKLSIACELAAKMSKANPENSSDPDRVKKDRTLGMEFAARYCPK